jgi:hypothetical protein
VLSRVTAEYVESLANPYTGPLATIPSYPALETKRQRSFVRGTFTVPSGSPPGWIIADPLSAAANDLTCLTYTLSTFPGNRIDAFTGTGIANATSNSEYTVAQINTPGPTSIQVRVVSAGLRIRYSDTELNRGGSVLALQQPQHQNLAGFPLSATSGYSITDMESFSETVRFPVTRKWMSIPYKPVFGSELDFQDTIPAAPNANTSFMGFMIQGDAAAATTYDFEFYVNHDLTGATVRGKQPSAVDFVGFSAAHSAGASSAALQPHNLPDDVAHQSFLSSVLQHLEHGVTWVKDHGVGIVRDVVSVGSALAALA